MDLFIKIGELADGANAAIYAANGDYLNGGSWILSVVPDGGDIIAKSLRNEFKELNIVERN
ncbi:MAG: hypothetical protein U0T81_08995 [Saprospiraceae bacterium]